MKSLYHTIINKKQIPMKIQQKKFSKTTGWESLKDNHFDTALCNFAIAFGTSRVNSETA